MVVTKAGNSRPRIIQLCMTSFVEGGYPKGTMKLPYRSSTHLLMNGNGAISNAHDRPGHIPFKIARFNLVSVCVDRFRPLAGP